MLNPAEERRGALVAELRRLRAKHSSASDKDLQAALGLKIQTLEEELVQLDAEKGTDATAPASTLESSEARAALEADLKRLQVKHDAVTDNDLKSALALSIQGLKERLSKLKVEEAQAPPEPLAAPPTLEEKEQADRLIQQARVEKMRGNAKGVSDLLAEASRIAPGSAEVLELLGDELADQRKFDEAIATYDKARKLDPKNVNVDKKHANLVFQSKAVGASAVMSIAEMEAMAASNKWAQFLSVIPGLGQIALTRYAKGATIFGIWFTMILWLFFRHRDLEGLLHSIAAQLGWHPHGADNQFSMGILVPILVALVTHAYAVFDYGATARQTMFFGGSVGGGKHKIDRPAPPVNLPFE
ncbi:MAG TPA: tetratricopeptide repeat protein [Fimbriimonadaceae bacterium]|nr:tetratricopeptide repeat protein [Fimbriimonadaceae bacterium]